jgi:DNA-binding FadR family transcriptional regulator
MGDSHQPSQRSFSPRVDKTAYVVARAIVDDLVRRSVPSGTLLPSEPDLMRAYDVGRSSLREALRILEFHGLITIKTGRGGGPMVGSTTAQNFGQMATLFLRFSRATFAEHLEARLAIEPVMAGLAAARAEPETIEMLRDAVKSTYAALDIEDTSAYIAGTTWFHDVVASASGNRILDLFGLSLKFISTQRVARLTYHAEDRAVVAVKHEEIAEAITRGLPRIAEELMREHMLEFTDQMKSRYPELMNEIVDWS